jgi:twitching motility protein PilT
VIGAKALLQRLGTRGISEITMVTGQSAYGNEGDTPTVLDTVVLTTDDILQILFAAGGSRHVDTLGAKASHWTARIEGVGLIDVTATMHGAFVQARFTLRTYRDATPTPLPQAPMSPGSIAPARASATPPLPPVRSKPVTVIPPQPPSRPQSTPVTAPARPMPAARPTPVTAPGRSMPMPGARPTPVTAPGRSIPLAARSAPVAPDKLPPSERPTPPSRPAARPPSGGDGAFDFALEEAQGRKAQIPQAPVAMPQAPAVMRQAPAAAPQVPVVIPPPPPPRLPLDTPFPDLSEFAASIPGAGRSPATPSAAFKELLLTARALRASDLHLVAGRPPAYRIAGELTARGEAIDAQRLAQMVLPRVPPRLLAALEHDGSADFALEEPGAGRFRVNVGRQRTGFKAAFRLIPSEIPTLAALGLPDAIGLATHHHQGLIVITGPTGHGKTTTLAAIVDILNRETARHVITVEDPVELVHTRKRAMMSQREVGTHTRSFQAALKASLREDPDVIVVGELRDTETVRMALSASETGHLVLGTMNTPSAAKTIDRLIDLFPPSDQAQVRATLAGGLRLVVGQRLLPSADRTQLVAAAELLPGSLALWNLIRDSRTFQIPSLQQRGKGLGIIRLDESLAALVQSGRIALDAAMSVAEAPAEFEARVNGAEPPLAPPRPGSFTDEASPERASAVPAAPRQSFFERAGALLGKRGS